MNHFHIILHTLFNTFGVEWFAYIVEVLDLVGQVEFYLRDGICLFVGIGAEDSCWVDVVGVKLFNHFVCHKVKRHDGIHFVAKKLNAQNIVGVSQCNIYGVTFHTETSAVEFVVVAYVL